MKIKVWQGALARSVGERDVKRQVRYNDLRKLVNAHVPEIFREYFTMIVGGLIAFWLVAELLFLAFHVQPLYTYVSLGLLYALQSTYYKYRLWKDPNYKIPKCRCNSRPNENMAQVLKSKSSVVMHIPISALAILFYVLLGVAWYVGYANATLVIAVAALCISAYMSYTMIHRIGSLCSICVNITALNVLIMVRLLF